MLQGISSDCFSPDSFFFKTLNGQQILFIENNLTVGGNIAKCHNLSTAHQRHSFIKIWLKEFILNFQTKSEIPKILREKLSMFVGEQSNLWIKPSTKMVQHFERILCHFILLFKLTLKEGLLGIR